MELMTSRDEEPVTRVAYNIYLFYILCFLPKIDLKHQEAFQGDLPWLALSKVVIPSSCPQDMHLPTPGPKIVVLPSFMSSKPSRSLIGQRPFLRMCAFEKNRKSQHLTSSRPHFPGAQCSGRWSQIILCIQSTINIHWCWRWSYSGEDEDPALRPHQ